MDDQNRAVVFPGQGSQRPEMGKDFYDAIPVSRDTYHEASNALGWDVIAMCFEENERLNLTEYSQPCILATEIAMFRGLQSLYDFSPAYFGGHSLGEYTALVAAGVLPFSDALKTVQARGRLMQEATPVGMGAMAAVIADDLDVNRILEAVKGFPIDLANENSTNQVVISGEAQAISEAEQKIGDLFIENASFRFVRLNVSAPFHSRFMETIEGRFRDVLCGIEERLQPAGAKRVTANATGSFHSGSSKEIIDSLVSQLSHTVRWRKNMEALTAVADSVIEIGPGWPLRKFFKTMQLECQSITTFSGAQRAFEKAGIRSKHP